ncbi:putative phage holin [Escherichia coli]|uniref:Putative phage holin n=1 Tax=Escherichia coli TaxID=562 RepID=A0A376KNB9_ECOLX|nr:putative phage holin [Escherichia coli]
MNNTKQKASAGTFDRVFFTGRWWPFLLTGEKVCLNPYPVPATAAALGGATVFGLFTGTDFGIVFGAFAGALFVATIPQKISVWRVAAHFLVSFIVGVLGAHVLSAWDCIKNRL